MVPLNEIVCVLPPMTTTARLVAACAAGMVAIGPSAHPTAVATSRRRRRARMVSP